MLNTKMLLTQSWAPGRGQAGAFAPPDFSKIFF